MEHFPLVRYFLKFLKVNIDANLQLFMKTGFWVAVGELVACCCCCPPGGQKRSHCKTRLFGFVFIVVGSESSTAHVLIVLIKKDESGRDSSFYQGFSQKADPWKNKKSTSYQRNSTLSEHSLKPIKVGPNVFNVPLWDKLQSCLCSHCSFIYFPTWPQN